MHVLVTYYLGNSKEMQYWLVLGRYNGVGNRAVAMGNVSSGVGVAASYGSLVRGVVEAA